MFFPVNWECEMVLTSAPGTLNNEIRGAAQFRSAQFGRAVSFHTHCCASADALALHTS